MRWMLVLTTIMLTACTPSTPAPAQTSPTLVSALGTLTAIQGASPGSASVLPNAMSGVYNPSQPRLTMWEQVGTSLRYIAITVNGAPLIVRTYPLASDALASVTFIGNGGSWAANGGTLNIDSISGQNMSLTIENAAMQPSLDASGNPMASGSFVLNLSATLNNAGGF